MPKGGSLSPLLANIMLDDLENGLEKRGYKYCRYAGNCNVYCKGRAAGNRVMKGIGRFLKTKLKLKLHESKSVVDSMWKRKFLRFLCYNSKYGIRISITMNLLKGLR
jgi:RNA-directed DNA polymerase